MKLVSYILNFINKHIEYTLCSYIKKEHMNLWNRSS